MQKDLVFTPERFLSIIKNEIKTTTNEWRQYGYDAHRRHNHMYGHPRDYIPGDTDRKESSESIRALGTAVVDIDKQLNAEAEAWFAQKHTPHQYRMYVVEVQQKLEKLWEYLKAGFDDITPDQNQYDMEF